MGMRRILVTGGGGFIGSHAAEFLAERGNSVVLMDNLSRGSLLGYESPHQNEIWEYLSRIPNLHPVRGDIRNAQQIESVARNVDVIIHTAAQTAVTSSLQNPAEDFQINAGGTLNVLEAARKSPEDPCVILCSTNKVYGGNVNQIPVRETQTRYEFADDTYQQGIPEEFSIDHCEHTPYGCSKLAADLYAQDYAHTYGLKTGIFRMSCIYGPRQYGVEDQGWVAWFIIATLTGKPVCIYGDGKQVRDILHVQDLVRAFQAFIDASERIHHGVYNIGGGPENTISLLEFLGLIRELAGHSPTISYGDWRASDQKVYVSDIKKAGREIGWYPEIVKEQGIAEVVEWVHRNRHLFH